MATRSTSVGEEKGESRMRRKGRNGREYLRKYLVGVGFMPGLIITVAVTGEIVMVLGGVNRDSGRWSAGPLRVNECCVVIRVVYPRARMFARRRVARQFCWSSQEIKQVVES